MQEKNNKTLRIGYYSVSQSPVHGPFMVTEIFLTSRKEKTEEIFYNLYNKCHKDFFREVERDRERER